MKTIGILTHYQVHNHGAILQMHGLYHTLENLGLQPTVLTYQKDFSFIDEKLSNKYTISLKSIPFFLGYLKSQGIAKTLFNFKKHRLLNCFKAQHYRFAPLQAHQWDYAVVGSDEVFSLETGINKMMYGHQVPAKTVFSYAASFGQTDVKRIAQKHCMDIISNGLKTFKAVCVRDRASADTVTALTGITPQICFDPVLLYGFEKELKNTSYNVPKQPYLVVYAYDNRLNDVEEITPIQTFARKHGLQIVSPGFYHKWADKNLNVTPLELLQVIKQAKYVITDTFHGSVMSILLNTPFATKVRDSNVNKMEYLLGSLGTDKRKLTGWDMLESVITSPVNWEVINANIRRLRQEGLAYLQGVLNEQK